MKKRVIDIISIVIIIISLIMIVRYFVISSKHNEGTGNEIKEYPLTEYKCINPKIDLGEVKRDSSISQDFFISNTGNNILVLKAINPDCNCTDFEVSKYSAVPGDSIRITLTVDATEKRVGNTTLKTILKLNSEEEYCLLSLNFSLTE